MDTADKKIAIVIAGMHRSGTSALSRALSLRGGDLPKTLMKPNAGNVRGHWESSAIAQFNQAILSSAGSSWDDWMPIDEGWLRSQQVGGLGARAQALLLAEFDDSPIFVLKDPRACRVLPFWIDALEIFGAEPAIVCPVRHPIEVAQSLRARDGIELSLGWLIWLRHVLDAETASRGCRRAFMSFESLLADGAATTEELGRRLNVAWPIPIASARNEIDAFIEPALRHHRRYGSDGLTHENLPEPVLRTFEILDRWTAGDQQEGDEQTLDDIKATLDAALPLFSPAIRDYRFVANRRHQDGQEPAKSRNQHETLYARPMEIVDSLDLMGGRPKKLAMLERVERKSRHDGQVPGQQVKRREARPGRSRKKRRKSETTASSRLTGGRPAKAKKRGFIAGFLRSTPAAAAAIILGAIFMIVAAVLPDRAVAIGLLGRAGPLVLLGVVVAVAYDRLGRRMRVRIFRAEREAARRTDRLRRKIGRLHKTSVAQRNRQRDQRRLTKNLRQDLTRLIDTRIGSLQLEQEADRASVINDIGEIGGSVQRLAERDVSLDIVSALRQLRGLIFPGNADVDIDGDESIEHGHRELMAMLASEALNKPGSVAGKTLVEVGTTRERVDGQGSTQKLAVFTAMLGMRFVSVDMDPENTESAGPVVKLLNPAAVVVTAKGEDYLAAMDAPIDYVYLDAFDLDHKGHSASRRERYKKNLGVAIVDEACWLMHLQCAYAIADKMAEGGIVTINDTWTDAEGKLAGKGKLAVQFLLSKDFEIVSRTFGNVTLRRTGGGSTDVNECR